MIEEQKWPQFYTDPELIETFLFKGPICHQINSQFLYKHKILDINTVYLY